MPEIIAIIVNGFPYVAVNCFILISGYFGIKVRLRGVLNIYLIILFYAILNQSAAIINGHIEIYAKPLLTIKHILVPVICCVSHSYNWFIPCYFILYLISPLINAGLECIDKKQFAICIILLSVVNLYFGYLWEHPYNLDGYSVGQMVYLYVIGKYISRFADMNRLIHHKGILLISYIVFALLWGIITIVQRMDVFEITPRIWRCVTYNNMFTILSSVSLFLLFSTFSIKSRMVNLISAGCFSVILVTGAPEFWECISITAKSIFDRFSVYGLVPEFISMIVVSVFITILICLLDSIRRWIMIPIVAEMDKFLSPLLRKLFCAIVSG